MCWPMCVRECVYVSVCVCERERVFVCVFYDMYKWRWAQMKVELLWTSENKNSFSDCGRLFGIWKKKNKNQVWILKATELGQAPELLVSMEG